MAQCGNRRRSKEKDAVQSCDILAEALSSAGIDHEINESVNSGNKDDYFSGESLEFGPEFASVSVVDVLSLEEASYIHIPHIASYSAR